MNRSLFLASTSPRRGAILDTFGIGYQRIKNRLQEEPPLCVGPSLKKDVRNLAKAKAFTSKNTYRGLILGVDTIVVIGDTVLGKPRDLIDAKAMLEQLSGTTHHVISAFCILDTISQRTISRSVTSTVTFKPLSDEAISHYHKHYSPLDKAGSYDIQEVKQLFVASLKGSYYNVVGLPIETLLRVLKPYIIERPAAI